MIDTSTLNEWGGVAIESGRVDDLMVCSCGRIWTHLQVHALTNKRRWA